MSLTSRIVLQNEDALDDPEDIFGSALETIFPDDVTNLHGLPGQSLLYTSPYLPSSMVLELCDPGAETERKLFSHYLWNSSLMISELIEADTLGIKGEREGRVTDTDFNITGRSVIELGAGTGLASIMAALLEARRVVATDYPSPTLLKSLKRNVARNVVPKLAPAGYTPSADVTVQGHSWGQLTDELGTRELRAFDRVIAADVLWMPWQHDNLRRSMAHFLSSQAGARCWVVGALHTGRDKIVQFIDQELLEESGLAVEHIWERDCDGVEREWQPVRENDFTNGKRWLVVIILKRA